MNTVCVRVVGEGRGGGVIGIGLNGKPARMPPCTAAGGGGISAQSVPLNGL